MATGTATLNFGAFPGVTDISVAITGQTGIISGSLTEAWILPIATADHSADEHMIEPIKVFAGNIVAGVGFTIYGFYDGPDFSNYAHGYGSGYAPGDSEGGRLYGLWTVGWVWL